MKTKEQELRILKFSLCRIELTLRKFFLRKTLFCVFLLYVPIIYLFVDLLAKIIEIVLTK